MGSAVVNVTQTTVPLWRMTTAATIANTTTETTLLNGTGAVGSLSIAANTLTVGTRIRFLVVGSFGTTLTPTIRARMLAGATVLADTTAQTPAAAIAANTYYQIETYSVVTAIGASGSITTSIIQWPAYLTALGAYVIPATATVDTTQAITFDLKWTWGTANALNTITSSMAFLEIQ